MSLAAAKSLAKSLAVRRTVAGGRSALSLSVSKAPPRGTTNTTTNTRWVQTVPKAGTEAEMQAEAIEQIRARIAYQKEVLAANPHKSHDEEWTELWTWIRISIIVCIPGCLAMVAKDLAIEEHHHRPEGPLPDYMSIRSKEFPWECDQCPFFDLNCWKKCRQEQQSA